jgi:hypothetical protein
MFYWNLLNQYYFTALIVVYIKDEAAGFSETSAPVYQNIQHYIKEHCKLKSVHETGSTERTWTFCYSLLIPTQEDFPSAWQDPEWNCYKVILQWYNTTVWLQAPAIVWINFSYSIYEAEMWIGTVKFSATIRSHFVQFALKYWLLWS